MISLKAARVNAKFKQEDVSKLLNVSTNTLSKWERGETLPRIDMAATLAALYGIPMEEIDFMKEVKK